MNDIPRLTLGSLFDGSGGFPLAGSMNGIIPMWASEVEPYPIAVTRSWFPRMEHLGNVMKIDGGKIPPVDVITFGSPCQDMSVAGKRAGMKHEDKGDDVITRSGLFYEAIRIIKEMRGATNGEYPTFAIWENVPGAFTSNKGEDFRCVLEEFARIKNGDVSIPRPAGGKWTDAGEIVGGGFSIAWRVFDAQYWSVPQRRRRIYLVADFADERAGKILFEREGVPRDFAPRGEAREGTAADVEGGVAGGCRFGCLNPLDNQARRLYSADSIFPALPAREHAGQNQQGVCYCIQGNIINRIETEDCNGFGLRADPMYTLTATDRHAVAFMAVQGAKARSIGAVEDDSPTLKGRPSGLNQAPSVIYPAIHPTLTAKNAANAESAQRYNGVVYDARGNGDGQIAPTLIGDHENRITDYTSVACMAHDQFNAEVVENRSPALTCDHKAPIIAHNSRPPRRYIVRRLTPTECARLQGFPDCWGIPDRKDEMTAEEAAFWERVRKTYAEMNDKVYRPCKNAAALLRWYNKLHTDSSEYKMWGNGIVLSCAAFVLEGIAETMRAGWEET